MQQKEHYSYHHLKRKEKSTNFQNGESYCNKSKNKQNFKIDNHTLKKLKKKKKMRKDHEKETLKPPYSTIKSHS